MLTATPKPKRKLEPALTGTRYRTPAGLVLFVAQGIGDTWGTFHEKPNGSLQRVKSRALPMRSDPRDAQADLDAYAARSPSLEPVTDRIATPAPRPRPVAEIDADLAAFCRDRGVQFQPPKREPPMSQTKDPRPKTKPGTALVSAAKTAPLSDWLDAAEKRDLKRLEADVARNADAVWDLARALREIRDRRLYRESAPTFDEYLLARWGFDRREASDKITALERREIVAPIAERAGVQIRESHMKALAGLEPADAKAVFSKAVSAAKRELGPGKITAAVIARAKRLDQTPPEDFQREREREARRNRYDPPHALSGDAAKAAAALLAPTPASDSPATISDSPAHQAGPVLCRTTLAAVFDPNPFPADLPTESHREWQALMANLIDHAKHYGAVWREHPETIRQLAAAYQYCADVVETAATREWPEVSQLRRAK